MNRENLQRQITIYNRRLQKPKEWQAVAGIGTDPAVLLEIEDIEQER